MTFSPNRLWPAWSLAPWRIRSYRRVRALVRQPRKRAALTPPPPELRPAQTSSEASVVPDARLRHVRLLGAAARGQAIAMREVLTLTHAWQQALNGESLARLHAAAPTM